MALGLMRACLCFATGSIATPFSILGLQSLSLAIQGKATVNLEWRASLGPSSTVFSVAIIAALLAFREYFKIRIFEYSNGLAREI